MPPERIQVVLPSRVVWLLVVILTAALTVNVLNCFEDTLA